MTAFAEWMQALDREIQRRTGFTSGDLEDWPFRDAFDDELSPAEAADDMLTEQGWDA